MFWRSSATGNACNNRQQRAGRYTSPLLLRPYPPRLKGEGVLRMRRFVLPLFLLSGSMFVLIAVLSGVLSGAARAETATAEAQAARETYIPPLRLYPAPAFEAMGIRIAYVPETVKPGNGRYTCGGLDQRRLAQAVPPLAKAAQILPAAAWRKTKLKYLLLCSTAKAGGREIGGIPVAPLRLLMLDVGEAPAATQGFTHTLLHELFHLIEMQDNSFTDAAWNAAFGGYDNSYGPRAGDTRPGSGGKGFVNGYGKSFPHEERAEIFARYALSPDVLEDAIARARDDVLQQKLDAVIRKSRRMIGPDVF